MGYTKAELVDKLAEVMKTHAELRAETKRLIGRVAWLEKDRERLSDSAEVWRAKSDKDAADLAAAREELAVLRRALVFQWRYTGNSVDESITRARAELEKEGTDEG